ncbi:CYTH domain-containing protein [Streptococcus panodentis]|uniref:Adenylate cyclase n=1 Tax=Streptococcus panodentis TaxID=1581472 RepID=A0ABS5AWV2_9STRE|nr:Adenylate cyclase [Streptococcus sp. DD11]MBP2621058.1 adenylate cyclase [Streptococcus panodentis]
MKHLEIELKSMLTQQEHAQLLPLFKNLDPVTQTNYYIDSPSRSIRQAHLTLRLRTFENAAELTLKIPQKIGLLEHNQALTLKETETILQNNSLPPGRVRQLLQEKQIPIEELTVLGSLKTIRYEKKTAIGLLALDQSHYFGKTDYELEVEVENLEQGKENFQQFLRQHKIHYKPAKSKIARFAENL